MSQEERADNHNQLLVKFLAPEMLKHAMRKLAAERSISLSALLRLAMSEYVRRTRQTW